MSAKINIAIPLYNNADTIADTINSLISQTFSDWHCFITDDSPNPETIRAATAAVGADSRFTIEANPVRLGAAGNWNKGLGLSSAPFFKLLCADDVLVPTCLEEQLNAMETHPNDVVAVGRRDIINRNGRIIFRGRGGLGASKSISANDAITQFVQSGTNYFGEPSFALFKTDALKSAGGFNPQWSYLIDVVSYLETLQHGDLYISDQSLGAFRISGTSWSSSLAKNQLEETLRCITYAQSLATVQISEKTVQRGRTRARINTVIRRLIFRFIA